MAKNKNSVSLSFLGFLSLDGLMGFVRRDTGHVLTSLGLMAHIIDQKFKISG